MGSYEASVLLATVRVVAAGFVLLVVVPRFVFAPRRPLGTRAPDHVVAAVATVALAVPLLAALRLLDLFSLALVLLGLAAAARAGRVRSSIATAWTASVVRVLDLAEAGRWRPHLPPRRPMRARQAIEKATAAVILGVAAGGHLADAFAHPADGVPGASVHITELKALAIRDLWPTGVRGTGVPGVLTAVGRVASVDSVLLVRLAPPIVATLTVAALIWAGRRLGGRPAAGLLAGGAGLVALSPAWRLVREPTGDRLTVLCAAALAVVAVALLAERLAVPSARPTPAWLGAAAVVAVAPPLGAAVVVALVLAWGGHRLTDPGPLAGGRLPLGVLLAGACGAAPIGLGLLLGRDLDDGPAGLESMLGAAFRTGALPPRPLSLDSVALVVGVLLSALVLLLPRRVLPRPAGARAAATVALLFVALSFPARFVLPQLLLPGAAAIVAAPLVALAAALAVDAVASWVAPWLRVAAGAVAVAAALAVAGSLAPVAAERRQPDEIVAVLYRIKDERRPYDWTVVDRDASLLDVQGHGFFLRVPEFVRSYDPERWRFDPDRRELALPTRSTFLVLRRSDRGDGGGASETGGTTEDDPGRDERAMREWMRRYEATHGPLLVVHDSPDLLVVEIRRSEADDRRFRRGGDACIRVPADDLVLPTPEEFEGC